MRNLYRQDRVEREKSRDVHFAGLVGGAVTAGMQAKGLGSPTLRRNSFFGTSMAIGILSDVQRGYGVPQAITSNTLSSAAGYAAYVGAQRVADLGLKALATGGAGGGPLLRGNAANAYGKVADALATARNVHPLFASLLSKETIGIGAAMATIPIAHKLVQRILAGWHRKEKSATSGETLSGTSAGGQAGRQDGRAEPAQKVGGGKSSVDLVMTGQLRTHYDHGRARRNIERR